MAALPAGDAPQGARAAPADSAGPARKPPPPTDLTVASPTFVSPPQAEPPGPTLPPDAFPGYTLVRRVHGGGQGVVYEALQHSTRRTVALKVLRDSPLADRIDRARFEREVQLLAQLRHPNIVAIHDSGVALSGQYFVMDFIPGRALDEHLNLPRPGDPLPDAPPPAPAPEALALLARIAEAVDAAHTRGITHRDLKPGNIRVDEQGEPHVLDFGLAKSATDVDAAMTRTGQFLGSLPWAAPEQAAGAPTDIGPPTDVYALGVMLFQLLTGRFPYDVTGSLAAVLDRILHTEPPRPGSVARTAGAAALDADLDTIALKCLQKDPARRYASAGALARDLRHYLAGEPLEARRDSLGYVARKRTGAALRRHPLLTRVGIILAAAVVAYGGGVPLIYRWTPANTLFERLVVSRLPTAAPAAGAPEVRVIALTDETPPAALAAAAGVSPVDLERDPTALRAAHGALLERLAAAGARVVAWNINFAAASPYDPAFVRGVAAVRAAGGAVVVGHKLWSRGDDGRPNLSPAIRAVTRWGAQAAELDAAAPWRIPLVLQRGAADPLPSLALATYAAFQAPAGEFDVRVEPLGETLTLLYYQAASDAPHTKAPVAPDEILQVSAIRLAEADEPDVDVRRGDVLAYWMFTVPSDATLAAATRDYGDVLTASGADLRAWCDGRIVLVGDARQGKSRFSTPDGRNVWATYAHAVAVDSLRSGPLRILSGTSALLWTVVAAAVATLASWYMPQRRRRVTALLAIGAACIGVALWAAWSPRVLFNPLVPLIAVAIAGMLTGPTRRARKTSTGEIGSAGRTTP